MSDKNDLMKKIRQLDFAMIELGLYLDNHPDCSEALEIYDKVSLSYLCAKREYENQYGPLCYDGVDTAKNGWTWIEGPWPWEGEC